MQQPRGLALAREQLYECCCATLCIVFASLQLLTSSLCCACPACIERACSIKFNTQQVVDGQIHENAIVQAANIALENTAKTLTWMLTPPLLKPLVWPLVARLPPPPLEALNIARMQLYTAALTLARNAMQRLGMPWDDDLNMRQAFGEHQGQLGRVGHDVC